MIKGKAFLVVDDMDAMRRILTGSLYQLGMTNVVTAADGAEAWRLLQAHNFDAVILDWNMPVMSGQELLQRIRADPKTNRLPVLMVTAETERHQVQMAIAAGVSEYMVKPFSVGALEAKLRRVIDYPHPPASHWHPQEHPVPQPDKVLGGPTAKAPGKPVLLVVDDVPENCHALVGMLKDDYQVHSANSGELALKMLDSGRTPDVIVLDMVMPDMDGYEVCRRIKANPATAGMPVILLSATGESDDVTRAFALGAADCVGKPVDPAVLRARINTQLRLSHTLAELRHHLQLRDDVDRMAQHDLKSPIAGIIGFSSSLLADPTLTPDHKEVIKHIEHAAYNVLDMVHLSLSLYKMENGSYTFHPSTVDLTALLGRIVRENASELAKRKLGVQLLSQGAIIESLPAVFIMGDELLCYSMFHNLFRNAMEAAAENTAIRLALEVEDSKACVFLTNDGVVPQEMRSTFFDKFSTSGKPGGVGLGTFAARLIAQAQRGEIAMHTSDAQYTTTLTVRLPCAQQGTVIR